MSAKMKRRRRHDRRKRVLVERLENAAFFADGTCPASARAFVTCSCGGLAFTRASGDHLSDFYDDHAYCDETDGVWGEML